MARFVWDAFALYGNGITWKLSENVSSKGSMNETLEREKQCDRETHGSAKARLEHEDIDKQLK